MSTGPDDGRYEESTERVRRSYDAVAAAYAAAIGDELEHKPLDRALLAALVELAGGGRLADVGCGPGHVTELLARHHPDVLGVDLSPVMVRLAQARVPHVPFVVGSMLDLPAEDGSWAAAAVLYSVIHLTDRERATAFGELARVLRPGGWMLLAFHVESPEVPPGGVQPLRHWFGTDVDLDGHYLAPGTVTDELAAAGLAVVATTVREADPVHEYPSRRCYLLARSTR